MRCMICERGCQVTPGDTGLCGRYRNDGGRMVERYPDRYLITFPCSTSTPGRRFSR